MTELRVLFIEYLDHACTLSPTAILTVYVDDMTIEASAREREVVACVMIVLKYLVSVMVLLRMRLSDTKCVCCASSTSIGRAIINAVPGLKLRLAPRVTSLGSALGAGRRRNTKVAEARLADFQARLKRFRRLRYAGVDTARLMRTGGISAMSFGQAVTGVSDKLLLRQRRAVAAAVTRSSGGGDLDVTLALADGSSHGRVDPAYEAHCQPIFFWAMAVWHEWMTRPELSKLMSVARARLATAKNRWAKVRGPAAAYVATAIRIGWCVQGPLNVTTDDGTRLDLCVDSPAFVKAAVDASVRRWRGRNIGRRLGGTDPDGLGCGPSFIGTYRLLDPRRRDGDENWGSRERAGLRSAAANRQWPQARLCRAGLADTPDCQLCVLARSHGSAAPASLSSMVQHHEAHRVEPNNDVPMGTAVHRIWECGTTRLQRQRLVSPLLRNAYQRACTNGTADLAVWTRGLMPTQQAVRIAEEHCESFRWIVRPVDGWIAGRIYSDGSMIDGPPCLDGLCRRLGWSFVALDNHGNITASACGVPAICIDTVYGAELWALWQAARVAMPGSSFRIDCLSVLKVFLSGRRAACNSRCKLARVWHGVFASMDDHESSNVDIAWMPSHTSAEEIGVTMLSDGTVLTAHDRRGNEEADRLAKMAAMWHRVPESVRRRMAADMEIAVQLRRWIGQAIAVAGNFAAPDGTIWRDSKPADRRVLHKREWNTKRGLVPPLNQRCCQGRGGRTPRKDVPLTRRP